MKDKIYDSLVRRNGRVWYEYERFVQEHIEEHQFHRLKHIIILLKLNWFYRVKKGNTPYLYWDVPLDPNAKPKKIASSVKDKKKDKIEGKKLWLENESSAINVTADHFRAKAMIKDQAEIYSFDVFDTMLMRPFSNPSDLFYLVGEKVGINDFKSIRQNAEKRVRSIAEVTKGNKEVTIRKIYEEINRMTGLDVEKGIKTEIEIEKQLCFANETNKEIFDILKSQGKRIIFITDMYLPSAIIDEILQKNGIKGYEKIFVSCEWESNKRNGDIYKVVQSFCGKATKIVHCGDNKAVDVDKAKELGIEARLYRNVNNFGKKYRPVNMSPLIGSAYSGIVNEHLYNGKNSYSSNYEYGFICGGIYVFGFMNWVNDFCKRNNVDKILFLSRDGYIYKKVYDSFFHDVDNEYFYWSRMAGLIYASDSVNGKNYFIRRAILNMISPILVTRQFSLKEMLENVKLGDLVSVAECEGIEVNMVITESNVQVLIDFIGRNWKQVLDIYKENDYYMKQTISNCLDGVKHVAIVDVGWNGSGPIALKYLINEKYNFDIRVSCLLAGSKCTHVGESDVDLAKGNIYTYMFSDLMNADLFNEFKKKSIYAPLFEIFTQANEPSFSHIDQDGKYIFLPPEDENYNIICEVHRGILDFCRLYYKYFSDFPYMFNINGRDAFLPFCNQIKNLDYFKKTMPNYMVQRTFGHETSGMWKLSYLIDNEK